MLQLPSGCSCSTTLSVFPKNWKTGGPSLLQKAWRIQYYFRDPSDPTSPKYGRLQIIKGMNTFKTLAERRQATQQLLDNELRMLQVEGYNPITKTFAQVPDPQEGEINPHTPFITALRLALNNLTLVDDTRDDIVFS